MQVHGERQATCVNEEYFGSNRKNKRHCKGYPAERIKEADYHFGKILNFCVSDETLSGDWSSCYHVAICSTVLRKGSATALTMTV